MMMVGGPEARQGARAMARGNVQGGKGGKVQGVRGKGRGKGQGARARARAMGKGKGARARARAMGEGQGARARGEEQSSSIIMNHHESS